jgi:hypothetical protein
MNIVPASESTPGRPAIFCEPARHGLLPRRYNFLTVYGVVEHHSQDSIVSLLSDYHRKWHARPVAVFFFEKENWTTWSSSKASGGHRGAEKLIRTVVVR